MNTNDMPTKKKNIKIYLSDNEHIEIAAKANAARLSMSTYAKKLCLGYHVHSQVDAEAVLRLIQLKAELGRIGGLLKLALSEGVERTPKITRLIDELEVDKRKIAEVIQALT